MRSTRYPEGVHPRAGIAAAAAWIAVALLLGASPARGSFLLAPGVGAGDNATVGTRVADPFDPAAALFANPAGLTGFGQTTISSSLGLAWTRPGLDASVPAGYDDAKDVFSLIPNFGVSIPYRDRWRFAFGSYGTSGSTFDFEADPSLGVPGWLSETIVAAFPVGTAYQLNDRVSLGLEVQPLFGQVRTHYEAGGLPFKYKINGLGVQGMFGVSVRPSETWAVGIGVRTPGTLWMGGSMPLPSIGLQHVHVAVSMPAQVFFGVTWRGVPRLALSSSARFTNTSSFSDSTLKFELTPQANAPFVPDANDEWMFGVGAEYAVRDDTRARIGAAYSSYFVGSAGVTPLAFDDTDIKVGVGLAHTVGHYTFEGTVSYGFPASREIPPDRALVIPGKYTMEGVIVILGFTYRK